MVALARPVTATTMCGVRHRVAGRLPLFSTSNTSSLPLRRRRLQAQDNGGDQQPDFWEVGPTKFLLLGFDIFSCHSYGTLARIQSTPKLWKIQGENWDALGKVATFALPVVVALAVAVGFFAAQTYNQDATVFLENAKSPEDTARLYSLE